MDSEHDQRSDRQQRNEQARKEVDDWIDGPGASVIAFVIAAIVIWGIAYLIVGAGS